MNFFHETRINGSLHIAGSILAPIQFMHKYIETNSQQKLKQLWDKCGLSCFEEKKFIVGHYSCPLEAGNRIYQFMNALIWALLTDRIFLWRYFDEEACQLDKDDVENRTCEVGLNTRQDCSTVLHLSSWVPSWEEWKVKLNLTEPIRAYMIGNGAHDVQYQPMDKDDNPRVLRVGPAKNLETAMILSRNPRLKNLLQLMSKASSRNNARALFAHGLYFAYGMLFESLFTLDPSLLPSSSPQSSLTKSFAIHSRHAKEENDGADVSTEISCMERVLRNRTRAVPCVVYVMADRQASKDLMMATLESTYNCTPIITGDIVNGTSFSREHGPFAGRGYFQDLALVTQARHGFMAPGRLRRLKMQGIRTSSGLPRSLMEFRRVLESLSGNASIKSIPPFVECYG